MATHPSNHAWSIPWTEEPGGLKSMGSQRVRPDWRTDASHNITSFDPWSKHPTKWSCFPAPHLTGEKVEAQEGWMICSRSLGWESVWDPPRSAVCALFCCYWLWNEEYLVDWCLQAEGKGRLSLNRALEIISNSQRAQGGLSRCSTGLGGTRVCWTTMQLWHRSPDPLDGTLSKAVSASRPACKTLLTAVLVTAVITPQSLELLKSKFLLMLYSTRTMSLWVSTTIA